MPTSASTNPHGSNERQSRARFKIDRETVLRINRCPSRRHRSLCDTEWPPEGEERPHVNTNTQRFDEKKITRKQVAGIREFFDNYEMTMDEWWNRDRNMTLAGSSKSAENLSASFNGHATRRLKYAFPHAEPAEEKENMNSNCANDDDDGNQSQFQQTFSTSTPNLSSTLLPSSPTCRLLSLFSPLQRDFRLPEEQQPSEMGRTRQRFNKSHDKSCETRISNVDGGELEGRDDVVGEECGDKELNKNVKDPAQTISQSNNSKVVAECSAIENSRNFSCEQTDDVNDVMTNLSVAEHASNLNKHRHHHDSHDLRVPIKTECSSQPGVSCVTTCNDDNQNAKDSKAIKAASVEEELMKQRRDDVDNNDSRAEAAAAQSTETIQHHHRQHTTRAPTNTLSSTTDKVSANFHNEKVKSINSTQSINETSTDPMTNSCRLERNLNLDLFFDREMSIWLSDRRCQRHWDDRLVVDRRVETNNASEIDGKMADKVAPVDTSQPALSSRHVEINMEMLNSKPVDDSRNDDDDVRISTPSFSDSFSTIVESDYVKSSRTNSEIDMKLIDNSSGGCQQHHHCCCCPHCAAADTPNDNAIISRQTFTDGEFIYGPYNFDLFTNHFYQLYDDDDDAAEMAVANDDVASSPPRHQYSSVELLKNHDELDNRAEVSFERAVDINDDHKSHSNDAKMMCGANRWQSVGKSADKHDDNVEIEIFVTNCSDEDDSQQFHSGCDAQHFNQSDLLEQQQPSKCDWNSTSQTSLAGRRRTMMSSGGEKNVRTTLARASIIASQLDRLDAPLIFGLKNLQLKLKMSTPASSLVNNSRQFNYERDDKIAIVENEFSCSGKGDRFDAAGQKMKISESNNQQQCRWQATNFNMKDSIDDDIENEIRIDQRQRQPQPSSSNVDNDIIGDNSSVKLMKCSVGRKCWCCEDCHCNHSWYEKSFYASIISHNSDILHDSR